MGGSADWAEPHIRQTTLVSHGRVQNEVLLLILNYILLKKDLDQARLLRRPRAGAHPLWAEKINKNKGFTSLFNKNRSFGHLGAILAHLGLHDASKSLQDGPKMPPRRLQDAPGRLKIAHVSLQDASKPLQEPPKMRPKTHFGDQKPPRSIFGRC